MKPLHILIVAYDFPPVGGIGVSRASKFTRYLTESGCHVSVLTNAHGLGHTYDHELMRRDIPENVRITRLGGERLTSFHHHKAGKKNSRARDWLLYCYNVAVNVDVYGEWYRSIKKHLSNIVQECAPDCVITTSPPHSTHLIGYHLSKQFNIPWVMDIRDSMVDSVDGKKNITQILTRRSFSCWENRFSQQADAIVTVSDPIATNMQQRHQFCDKSKFHTVFNGFDKSDFDTVVCHTENEHPAKLELCYAGTFLGNRQPDVFISAVNKLVADGSVNPEDIKLLFLGNYDKATKDAISQVNKEVELELPGFVPHAEALKRQARSHILLLITAKENSRAAAEVMTGKVFEMMALEKPVLALCHKGPLDDLIQKTGIGQTAPPDNHKKVADRLLAYYLQWKKQGRITIQANEPVISQYSRQRQTRKILTIIERIVEHKKQKN